MKVLITGASGLLGRAIFKEFSKDQNVTTVGIAFSRTSSSLRRCDLTDKVAVAELFKTEKPDYVIHAAAERRPDVVQNDPQATERLNVDATKVLCELAAEMKSTLIYISTDYVFDGTQPPYKEDAKPNPLNAYGQSKLDGEIVVQTFPGNIILRVPILYGQIEKIEESAVTTLFTSLKDTTKVCSVDNYQRRYPTYVADVATVLHRLLDARHKDSSVSGIFHFSGKEMLTKCDMVKVMAEALDLPMEHIKPNDSKPEGTVTRPYDVKLACERLEKLGIACMTPFREGIASSLKKFLD